MSRSTAATGEAAPSPVSRPGRSCSAQASLRRCPGCRAASRTAAATTSAVRLESIVLTTRTTASTGSTASRGPQNWQ